MTNTTETAFDRDELASCYERLDLYLEGKANDERIEVALAEAGSTWISPFET